VIVSTKSNGAFNKGRTGASQQFSNREITAVPITGSRSISSVTKYNANAGSGGSLVKTQDWTTLLLMVF
jgi:hypothetical protein